MERDVEQEYKPLLFDDPDLFAGTFPEAVERVAAFLEAQENIGMLTARLQTFAEQYAQNREMMRSPTYNPTRMSAVFERLARPWAAYQSREAFIRGNRPRSLPKMRWTRCLQAALYTKTAV